MLLEYVNMNIGTNSSYRQSKGNTLPLVQYPFGMQAITLQTDKEAGAWFYKPNVNYAEGIRFTNQPSPWLGDYGNITIMPSNTLASVSAFERHSTVEKEIFRPDRMKVQFKRYNAEIDVKPLMYGASIDVTISDQDRYLIIEIPHQAEVDICDHGIKIVVYGDDQNYGQHFAKYYVINSKSISALETIERDGDLYYGVVLNSEKSHLDVGCSYISHEQATQNLKVKKCATSAWNQLFAKMEIDADIPTKQLFYSNLYRVLLYPHIIHENVEGQLKYKNFQTGKLDNGYMYVDVGYWDTYRTTMPLIKKIDEQIYRQIIKANINFYRSYQWLARWVSPIERGIMPSTLTDSVVAEAIVGGYVDDADIDLAIEALLKNGSTISTNELHGRRCLKTYIENGYVSCDDSHESVSMTLDNAYCDYAIAKALEKVGHPSAKQYFERSTNYLNLFNDQSLLFERKDKNGNFDNNFQADEWGVDFCESSAWQNNFNFPHGWHLLEQLFGSKEAVCERLDFIFNAKPTYQVGRYGFEIHEMTEFASCNLGYFAISNQPSFLLPFVYLQIGEEEKFNQIINRTLKYFTSDDYPGDEDNGSLSAWLIWVLIGEYPICPVDNQLLSFTAHTKNKINFSAKVNSKSIIII